MNRPWEFEQFCEKYGEDAGTDVMERISEAIWDKTTNDRIRITHRHRLDICSYVVDGDIEYAGEWFSFIVESGDWDGDCVLKWGGLGEVEPYTPMRPTVFDLMPEESDLEITRPALFDVYLAWRDASWFSELARAYNYDRYFAPGSETESHYCARARERGLVFASDTKVAARIDAYKRARAALSKAKGEGQ